MIPPRWNKRASFGATPKVGDLVMYTYEVTPMVGEIRDLSWKPTYGVGIVLGLSKHVWSVEREEEDPIPLEPIETHPSAWDVWFPKDNVAQMVWGDDLTVVTKV